VLQWNTHHGGYGTDGVYDPDRLASWIVKISPDIVMLNEIEKNTGWGKQDQPEVYKSLLEAKTGKTWYYVFAEASGNWTANGDGNLILSSVPFDAVSRYYLGNTRSAAEVKVLWNGRRVTLFETHLDADYAATRLAQMQNLLKIAAPEPENRLISGDMNASASEATITTIDATYFDTWAHAVSAGSAVAFSGNTGQTRNTRIDYIFLSKGAADLQIVSSQVFDTRDANGVMPSDHRPLLTTFAVR
jgi:endonuclease/exonuclease/phosphatase family metal-dependent hydrolase